MLSVYMYTHICLSYIYLHDDDDDDIHLQTAKVLSKLFSQLQEPVRRVNKKRYINTANRYLQLTSSMTTLLFGGVRFVLLATQTNLAFKCCRPIFGYDKWLTVLPSVRCSNDSSITELSKYQVTFGRGRPIWKSKHIKSTKMAYLRKYDVSIICRQIYTLGMMGMYVYLGGLCIHDRSIEQIRIMGKGN